MLACVNFIPVAMGQVTVSQISVGGRHTCAVTTAGVRCWGENASGQLGDGTLTSRAVPANVVGLPGDIVEVSAGSAHTCALSRSGRVWCWGNNFGGQLGNGRSGNDLILVATPAEVEGLGGGAAAISSGLSSTCAVTLGGAAMCWGTGGTGDGTSFLRARPTVALGVESGATAVWTNTANTCVLMSTGGVKCWGYRPTLPTEYTPRDVPQVSGAIAITAGCALLSDATVRCWQSGPYAPFPSTAGVRAMSGTVADCIVTTAGAAKCWNYNFHGRIGDGTRMNRSLMTPVAGLDRDVAAISTGLSHSCAVSTRGEAWCWGDNGQGQLGDGTTVPRLTPASISGIAGRHLAAGAGPHSGLWYNPSEAGWGLDVTHRRNVMFLAWYVYDATGQPKWYVAPDCAAPEFDTLAGCSGSLYEASGPAFFGVPFSQAAVRPSRAGTVRVSFSSLDAGTLEFTVGSVSRTVPIARQAFGSGPAPLDDYTDLWWNAQESGWGLAVTHRGNKMFLAWYVYDSQGRPVWIVGPDCGVDADGNGCTGALYRTTGPALGASFDPSLVRANPAGTATLRFIDPDNGVLTFTVDGVAGTKAITRQVF